MDCIVSDERGMICLCDSEQTSQPSYRHYLENRKFKATAAR